MKKLQIQLIAVCLSAGLLSAQAPRATAPLPPAAAVGCQQTSGGSLRALPASLLDQLERKSASVFVQAFLLNFVASTADTNNWLARCAITFIRTPLDESANLVARQVSVTTIIRELRATDSAETVARDIRRASDSSLRAVARRLTTSSSTLASFEGAAEFFQRGYEVLCPKGGEAYCGKLRAVVAAQNAVAVRHQSMDSAYSLAENAARVVARTSDELAAVVRGQSADSAQRQQAQDIKVDASLVDAVIDGRRAVVDSLRQAGRQLQAEQSVLGDAGKQLQRRLDSALLQLQDALGVFREANPPASGSDQVRSVGEVELGVPAGSLSFSTEPPERIPSAPAVASPNLLVAFTDFVIDRAKQELVLAYITDVYKWMSNEKLLQVAFPETYAMMRSIVSDSGATTVSEVAIGRLSLATWQATLVSDFRALPVNLMAAAPSALCGKYAAKTGVELASQPQTESEKKRAADEQRARRRAQMCAANVTAIQPLSKAARRVMAGEPVFNVLRDLQGIALESWPKQGPELRRLAQGLAVVRAVVDAYYLQGNVDHADPVLHPYVVTVDALTQMLPTQRQALERLILLRVLSYGPPPFKLDSTRLPRLYTAVLDVARNVEAMREPLAAGEARREQVARVVHHAFVAARASAEIALFLADSADSVRIEAHVQHWTQFADAIDPMVAGNYGLAMARTTVLLRNVFDTPLSRQALALTSLAAALADAQNGDQVRSAFESAAAPVGGWRAKRYHEGGRVSISAFPGFAFGREYVTRGKGGLGTSSVGVSLPIGIDWQWTFRRNDLRERPACTLGVCSFGAVFSVMDLGALLSYRVKGSDEVKSDVDPSLRQVFAPGLMFSLGVGRTPLAILLGGQYMPQLRNVTTAGSSGTADAYRFAALVTLDLKLFDF